MPIWTMELGANVTDRGAVSFKVWAPRCGALKIQLVKETEGAAHPMQRKERGYFHAELDRAKAGDHYFYILDNEKRRPDPASRWQPEGVHGSSCVIDPEDFQWTDKKWKGHILNDLIFYEMHTGTFTAEGTFRAAIEKIPYLKKLGVTCLELMPVAQFPGKRNWGYDGVGLFAAQNSYGGPEGLKALVNACHRADLAVCLDVVYNHLGPEGNYLHDYGPYFTDKYHTPWGDAVNYDGPQSGPVRNYIIDNALFWVSEYHIDALRLDAIHGIYDFGAKHILEELNERVQEQASFLGRKVHVIAESDLNDTRIIRPRRQGGYGLAGQWNDDFHHAVHAYVTGEKKGYYEDFGQMADTAKTLQDRFVYDGRYSEFRMRQHGNSARDLPPEKFVNCIQNHDQVGNRALGERLSVLASFECQKLSAVLLLTTSANVLLFMGQEYNEIAPFLYFIDHGDPALVDAVREGRRKEFASFGWQSVPDPALLETFLSSKLDWSLARKKPHDQVLRLYQDLIRLRKKINFGKYCRNVWWNENNKWLAYEAGRLHSKTVGIIISFSEKEQIVRLPFRKKQFITLLGTEEARYGGKSGRLKKKARGKIALAPRTALIGFTG